MQPQPVGPVATIRHRAMGTDVQIVVTGSPAAGDDTVRHLASLGVRRLDQLEQLWTRFDERSELRQVTKSHGRPVPVSATTRHLVRSMTNAWQTTAGLFDPTVAAALRTLGYDADFDTITRDHDAISGRCVVADRPERSSISVARGTPGDGVPAPGCGSITIDDVAGTLTVPAGVELDPGGIGKGLAADLVAARLMAGGAAGVLVNIGGDIRTRGLANDGYDHWLVAVNEPTVDVRFELLIDGAVATSTNRRRRWPTSEGGAHHLVDPMSGRSTSSPVALVTAVANSGVDAEVATKAVYVGWMNRSRSEIASVVARLGADVFVVLDDGHCEAFGDFDRHVA